MKQVSVRLALSAILFLCSFSPSKAQVDIDLISPENEFRFSARDVFSVVWVPVNGPAGNRTYTVKVVTVNEGQTADEAIAQNEPFLLYTTPVSPTTYERSHEFSISLPTDTRFAWKVTANFPDTGETGESEIRTFYGPLSVASFFAGAQTVIVDTIFNTDRNSFAGRGRTKLGSPAAWTPIEFDSLTVIDNGFNVLTAGEIFIDTTEVFLKLPSIDETNDDTISFAISRYRLNAEGLYVYGAGEIPPPLKTEWAGDVNTVTSDSMWMNFNSYVLNGIIDIPGNRELLMPEAPGFKFVTHGTDAGKSTVYVNTNRFWYGMRGNFLLSSSGMEEPFIVNGGNVENFEIVSITSPTDIKIPVAGHSGLFMNVLALTLDLSTRTSVQDFESDTAWTGVIFDSFGITLQKNLDTVNNQLILSGPDLINLQVADGTSYLTQEEWSLNFSYAFDIEVPANLDVYSASIDSLVIHLNNHNLTDSHIYGKIVIPAIVDAPLRIKLPFSPEGLDTCFVLLPESETYAKLSKPYLAVVSDTLHSGFQLNWYPDTLATSYLISISDDAFATTLENFTNVEAGTDTTFIIEGLEPETQYWYVVHSVRPEGASTSLTAKITTAEAPPVVTGVDAEVSSEDVCVSPNPFTVNFELRGSDEQTDQYSGVRVYAATGQVLFHSNEGTIGEINQSMNQAFAKFESGFYLLQVNRKDGKTDFVRMIKK